MQRAFEGTAAPRPPGEAAARRLAGRLIGAVVEVSADASEGLRSELIAWTYRASRSALMVLVVHGLSRAAVDAALTPTVREVGLDVHGVLYLDGDDGDAVREAVHAAPLVIASSDGFRARLSEWGVPFLDARDAVRGLARRVDRTRGRDATSRASATRQGPPPYPAL